MARVKNTIQLTKTVKVNPRYSMTTENMEDIKEASSNSFYMMVNSFRFGYMQGMKAAKAEMKQAMI